MSHKKHHHEPEQDNEILKEIRGLLREVLRILKHEEQNDKLTLSIGGFMGQPAQLVLGQAPVQSVVTESLLGVNKPLTGAIAFVSDNPSVATVDPASGLVTQVALGTANVTATDSTNVPPLSDIVAVTVVAPVTPPPAQNDALQLSIPSQTP